MICFWLASTGFHLIQCLSSLVAANLRVGFGFCTYPGGALQCCKSVVSNVRLTAAACYITVTDTELKLISMFLEVTLQPVCPL